MGNLEFFGMIFRDGKVQRVLIRFARVCRKRLEVCGIPKAGSRNLKVLEK